MALTLRHGGLLEKGTENHIRLLAIALSTAIFSENNGASNELAYSSASKIMPKYSPAFSELMYADKQSGGWVHQIG